LPDGHDGPPVEGDALVVVDHDVMPVAADQKRTLHAAFVRLAVRQVQRRNGTRLEREQRHASASAGALVGQRPRHAQQIHHQGRRMAEVVEETDHAAITRRLAQVRADRLGGRNPLRVLQGGHLDAPEIGTFRQLARLLVGGKEHLLESAHGVLAGLLGGTLERLQLGAGCGGWLLEPDMLSGGEAVGRDPRIQGTPVGIVTRHDEHCVDRRVVQQTAIVRTGVLGSEPPLVGLGLGAVQVAGRDELDRRELEGRKDVAVAVVAAADETHPHGGRVDKSSAEIRMHVPLLG